MTKDYLNKANVPEYGELLAACRQNNIAKAKDLLDRGADIDETTDAGNTALILLACGVGYKNMTELLISRGADLNKVNHVGNTALLLASYHGAADIAQMLIENGAKLDIKNNMNETPLFLAEEKGYSDIALMIRQEIKDRAEKKSIEQKEAEAKRQKILKQVSDPSIRRRVAVKRPPAF